MLAPLVEPGPRAQILAEGVEPLLDFRADGPMTVTAVTLVVDRRRLLTADALLPHAEGTTGSSLRIRRTVLAVAGG